MFDQNNETEKKLDWMYKGAHSLVNREDYLLGRSVDKTLDQLNSEEKNQQVGAAPPPKNHVEHECIPPSIRDYKLQQKLREQVDLQAKLQEDPLIAIQKREEETRRQFLQNPVQLKKLQKALSKQNKKSKKDKEDLDKKLAAKLHLLSGNVKETDLKKGFKRSKQDKDVDIILMHKFNALKGMLSENDLQNIMNGNITDSSDESSSERESSSDEYKRAKTKKKKKTLDEKKKKGGKSSSSSEEESGDDNKFKKKNSRKYKETQKTRRNKQESSSSDDNEVHKDKTKTYKSKSSDDGHRYKANHNSKRNKERHESLDESSDTDGRSRSKNKSRSFYEDRNTKYYKQERARKKDNYKKPYKRHNEDRNNGEFKRNQSPPPDGSRNYQRSRKSRSPSPSKSKSYKRKDKNDEIRTPSSPKIEVKGSDTPSPPQARIIGPKKPEYNNSDNSEDDKKIKNWGLVKSDGTKIPLQKPKLKVNDRKEKSSGKVEPPKYDPKKRKRLTEEEKERLRIEMIINAVQRDEEREKSFRKYREDKDKEEKRDYNPEFLQKELLRSANSSTVESRIRSNLNNIQRSSDHMNSHFSKRH